MTEPTPHRPRPQYGEYAEPEAVAAGEHETSGSPETPPQAPSDATISSGATPPGATLPPGATSESTAINAVNAEPLQGAMPSGQPASTAGRLPGVPHNLGVSGASTTFQPAPNQQAAAPPQPTPASRQQTTLGEPYRAESPGTSPSAPPQQVPNPGVVPAAVASPVAKPARRADRIITIVLLVLGAFGALNMGFSAMQLPAQVAQAAQIFEIDGFVVPASISTVGTVGAIILLALYAVTLIASIQRLRTRKLTFWLPLSAGVLALIVSLVISLVAFGQSPELMQAMADPEATQKMLDFLRTQGG